MQSYHASGAVGSPITMIVSVIRGNLLALVSLHVLASAPPPISIRINMLLYHRGREGGRSQS